MSGGRAGDRRALSANTVLHVHRLLFQALKYAVRQGLLIRNPAELVDPPRARKPVIKTLIPSEVFRLLDAGRDNPYYPVIFAAISTGLRQSELLGLRWRDVDLDLASISVTQVLYKRCRVFHFKVPKSDHRRRRVDLTLSLALFLREYRDRKRAEYILLGKVLSADDLVFCDVIGRAIDPGTLTHNFARITRKAGLAGTRFHDLRHTFASLMLMAGVHPKIVSEMLGHASVAFTLDVYSHVVGGLQREAVKQFDDLLLSEMGGSEDVGNMSAENPESGSASGQIRTVDRRFTKPLLYP